MYIICPSPEKKLASSVGRKSGQSPLGKEADSTPAPRGKSIVRDVRLHK